MLIQLVYTEAPGNKLTVFYKKRIAPPHLLNVFIRFFLTV